MHYFLYYLMQSHAWIKYSNSLESSPNTSPQFFSWANIWNKPYWKTTAGQFIPDLFPVSYFIRVHHLNSREQVGHYGNTITLTVRVICVSKHCWKQKEINHSTSKETFKCTGGRETVMSLGKQAVHACTRGARFWTGTAVLHGASGFELALLLTVRLVS